MSTFEIKMPKLGESITEGTIVAWSVKTGDTVREDDILFEVTTAKVNAEVPSPVAGTVLEILFKEGDTVPIGVVVALMQLEGEDATDVSTEKKMVEPALSKPTVEPTLSNPATEPALAKPSAEKLQEEARWYSPVVLQIAKTADISTDELDRISGTGYLGRLSKKDINNYIDSKQKGLVTPLKVSAAGSAPEKDRIPVSNPQSIDVPSFAAPGSKSDDYEIREMDPIRRIIADRMVQSRKISAHVTTVVEVDVTKLVQWRDHQKDSFLKREGISLTFLPAIVEATTKALIDFPLINASVEGYQFLLKKHINIGIAVSLEDGNLIVPVIHDADKMSISGLAQSIDSLANKARSNKLKMEDIQGGTFTITNFGTFKNVIGTPIINQPEVAILGIGYIEKKPAVLETPEGDVIAIRHKMYLSLSYDHRLINGSLGGAFVRRIADYLENWETS